MGWTWYHCTNFKLNGKIDVKGECDRYFDQECYTLLKSALIGTTYYAAVRDERDGQVFAAVFLTGTNMRDYYNFGYKDMDETYGPCQAQCPVGILDLLSPTDSERANQWRERCRAYHDKERFFRRLPCGTRVVWEVPNDCFKIPKGTAVVLEKNRLNPYNKNSKFGWVTRYEWRDYFIDRKYVDLDAVKIA